MRIPRRFLPPTHLLTALEASARTGSFTEAAKELDLTQSAVSRQIRNLEDQIGFELFVREHQTIRLTEAGAKYAYEVRLALRHIAAASMGLRANPRAKTLNVATVPALGNRWLVPRLKDFNKKHPDVTVNIYTRPEVFDFAEQAIDVAVHFGSADWMGCNGVELMDEAIVPMASPDLLAEGEFTVPADLLGHPLLVLSCRPDSWETWFTQTEVEFDFIHGPIFDQMEACAAAAVSGAGIALLPKFLFQRELNSGQLKVVFEDAMHSRLSYRAVWPVEKENNALRGQFVTWLVDELARR
ncbi:LysR family glycine cleavage system transcriptional activator [Sinorhizobium fredii]|uniref:Glycine cleavage system transcriptional activator n=1 Tax=Sinorhizobium fredii (strain USDA 257) TaxID=1185652 RepID=I3XBW6_SINF2|nr:LysR substrate-binding domain-containing protein [Sinorhizobium fredii]AFL53372.1 glycine cleavage system transcriptional activator [Sinorhizobium fredii USDA 257]